MDMKLSSISEDGGKFVIHGTCPHCAPTQSAFTTVSRPFAYEENHYQNLVAVARCIACHNFILVVISYRSLTYGGPTSWHYAFHYPIGKPHDRVDPEIPEHIAQDFSEALRCQWVNAYNATAEMCRRTVESACINLGAPFNKVLQEMINWLEAQKIITPTLKDVAHKVRLGGDRGAHPPEDPNFSTKYEPSISIEEEHAAAIVEFTQHFLEHVYVIPKRLPTYDFSKPKAKKP